MSSREASSSADWAGVRIRSAWVCKAIRCIGYIVTEGSVPHSVGTSLLGSLLTSITFAYVFSGSPKSTFPRTIPQPITHRPARQGLPFSCEDHSLHRAIVIFLSQVAPHPHQTR